MPTNTTFQTRIQLKYDTYANWTTNNPVLLAGEMALATVPSEGSNTGFQNLPNVVAKIGDGSSHYNDLPYLSGLAADVYGWAKAAVKPAYSANEITGLTEFVEGISDIDTNTQYQLVAVEGATYKYQLQKKDIGDADWSNVTGQVIDFSGADTRLTTLEETVGALTGASGGIQGAIDKTIQGLDATVSQTAGADGLALEVVQENGTLKSVSGSIKANTYDAYGAAATVDGKLTAEKERAEGAEATLTQGVADNKAAIEQEVKDRKDAIAGLDYSGYAAGSATGETISFVGTISEENGVIKAEKRDLVFNTAYDPTTNKAATMADITKSVADLNGAMHYKGTVDSDPTTGAFDKSAYKAGDVIIFGIKEYIYDGTKFDQLGDEGAAASLIAGLDKAAMACDADSTVKEIVEENGLVTATYQKIQVAESQVTGLTTRLSGIDTKISDEITRAKAAEQANADAIATLNGAAGVEGSVQNKINTTIGTLNTTGNGATGSGNGVNVTVKQESGVVTGVTVSVDANTYDTYGAADAVLGKSADASTANTVYGAKKAAAEALAAAQAAQDKADATLTGVDATVEATAKATDGSFGVLTKVVQKNGVLVPDDSAEIKLAKVAETGKIDDLSQTAYVIFSCGTSSVNI